MDLETTFADFEAPLGVTDATKKALAENGVVTVTDFLLLSKADLSELRSGPEKVNMGQMNKLGSICRRVKQSSTTHSEPPSDAVSQPQTRLTGSFPATGSNSTARHPAADTGEDSQPAAFCSDNDIDHFNQLLDGIQAAEGQESNRIKIQDVRNKAQLDRSGKNFDLLQLLGGSDAHLLNQDPLYSHATAQKGYSMPTKSTNFDISPDDPRASLLVRTNETPVLDIRQFLSQETKQRLRNKRTQTLVQTGEQAGKLKGVALMTDDDLQYSGIRMGEWGEANMKLCFRLQQLGNLSTLAEVQDYMAYTAMIFSLGQKYFWENVMAYDFAYRERQAALGFRWGTNVSLLDLTLLGNALVPDKRAPIQPKKVPNRDRQPQNVICRQFANLGRCNYGEKCIYKHVTNPPRSDTSNNGRETTGRGQQPGTQGGPSAPPTWQ